MGLSESRYRPRSSRRAKLVGLLAVAAALVHAQQPSTPQQVREIEIGGTAARFAIPDCVPKKGDDATREACRTVAEVLRADLRFEGLFQFVPESLFKQIPTQNPDLPNFEDWKGIGAKILVITRADVAGGELTVELKVHFVDSGQQMMAKRYTGKADNPRVFAHVRTYEEDIVLCVHNLARSAQAVELDLSRWEGFVPEEMFGRSRFPRIGELPYLLTLGPRGFFWFQLRKDEEE